LKKISLPSVLFLRYIIREESSSKQVLASITLLSWYTLGKKKIKSTHKKGTKRLPSLSWFFLTKRLIVERFTSRRKLISKVSNRVVGLISRESIP
jgi:hypothetical protein